MNLLVVLGPTASGKTQLAVSVARRLDGEIISADSRQVYRGLDIGTGKDLEEYGSIPYHLIDIVNPGDEFSLFDYLLEFSKVYNHIKNRCKLPVLVGGTGLYLDAVLRNYQLVKVPKNSRLRSRLETLETSQLVARLQALRPRLHNTTDLDDRTRLIRAIEIAEGEHQPDAQNIQLPRLSPSVFGLQWPRTVLRQRITRRLRARLNQGMVEEVKNLHASGVSWDTLDYYGLEYRYVAHYLQGHLTRNDLFQKLNSAIHQFAKRQETWFRRMERQGINIHWLNAGLDPASELLDACGDEKR